MIDRDKEYYKNASGIDIDNAHSQYDTARAVGYDGEFAFFKYLLNDNKFENAKILTNLEIPSKYEGKTTEIDMLLITEYGLIVFEVKNYKGTIYGKQGEPYWTQYFKTVSNQKFRNPIRQNEYHIMALEKLVVENIYSIIYFANPDCNISNVRYKMNKCVVADEATLTPSLNYMVVKGKCMSEDRVEELFQNLKKYSKAIESDSSYQETGIASLNDFILKSKQHLKNECEAMEKTIASS